MAAKLGVIDEKINVANGHAGDAKRGVEEPPDVVGGGLKFNSGPVLSPTSEISDTVIPARGAPCSTTPPINCASVENMRHVRKACSISPT